MSGQQPRYLSYLLRLWQTSNGGEGIWRASVESPSTGERQGFAALEDLFDFLEARTSQTASQDKQDRVYDVRGEKKLGDDCI